MLPKKCRIIITQLLTRCPRLKFLNIAVRYPRRLLPTINSKIITEIDSCNSHFLGKWVPHGVTLKDEDEKLSVAAIDLDRIPGFSTNKIPSSKKQDLKIYFPKPLGVQYEQSWTGGENAIAPSLNHFDIDYSRQLYFFQICKINGFTDTYQNPPNKPDNNFSFRVKIVHRPLKANFWHFEIEVDSDHGIVAKNKAAWHKIICSSIRDRLQEISVFKI